MHIAMTRADLDAVRQGSCYYAGAYLLKESAREHAGRGGLIVTVPGEGAAEVPRKTYPSAARFESAATMTDRNLAAAVKAIMLHEPDVLMRRLEDLHGEIARRKLPVPGEGGGG